MLTIGSYNALTVGRAVDFGLYLRAGEEEVLLPSKYVPQNTAIGDTLSVFVYNDSQDRPVATTLCPKAVVGDFAFLKVTAIASFGAFMDWGLEKDLLVPNNEQPTRMKAGRSYVVKLCLDEKTRRVFGTGRIARNCEIPPKDLIEGKKVDLLIYGHTKIGMMAIVDNRYSGMLTKENTRELLLIGTKTEGYISRIHEDGKIDLTLKPPGHRSIPNASVDIMALLVQSGGFIACHDKSPPDEIYRTFAMSKKEFKKAIGSLYKAGKITLTNQGIKIKP
ncbi:MAG: S1-like domain-containing RNA-binding protein [Desulfobacterales bacterium]|jgi:predicted RNA-binding protein (virulence factor B family)|nr:S1-like domain-containing RNA-binding protein [Desulfobacterales bacterium]